MSIRIEEKIGHPSRTIFNRSIQLEDILPAKPEFNLVLGKLMKAISGTGWNKPSGLLSMALGFNPSETIVGYRNGMYTLASAFDEKAQDGALMQSLFLTLFSCCSEKGCSLANASIISRFFTLVIRFPELRKRKPGRNGGSFEVNARNSFRPLNLLYGAAGKQPAAAHTL